mmetsp:Transcript_130621/g.363972  ORF Transcript_130621/g.363972 Transcript_130621/m.363972 type:complete len:242 (-) Transcript_130621:526-1251(-)
MFLPATDGEYGFQLFLLGLAITVSTLASFARLEPVSLRSRRTGWARGIGMTAYSLPEIMGILGCIRFADSFSSSLRLSAVSGGGRSSVPCTGCSSPKASRSKLSCFFVSTCLSHFCTSIAAIFRFATVSFGFDESLAMTEPRAASLLLCSASFVIGSLIMHSSSRVRMWTLGSSPVGSVFSHKASARQPSYVTKISMKAYFCMMVTAFGSICILLSMGLPCLKSSSSCCAAAIISCTKPWT